MKKISIIGSDKFNKSATLDIETNLIQYISAEGTFKLQNGNHGQVAHNYYQQSLYKDLFKNIWTMLLEKRIVTRSMADIENSELFKYSPYKRLNEDQYTAVIDILELIAKQSNNTIFIKGSAGTGKTILATYLVKLLTSIFFQDDNEVWSDEENREIQLIKLFRQRHPSVKIGLVVAMTSLRESLKAVFKQVPGLKPSMILSPSEVVNSDSMYDLLIVDEAHRLRQYRNIGWMGVFRKNNVKLGLNEDGTELDWILKKSRNQVFFYDANQSVKPSDVNAGDFTALLGQRSTFKLELKSQMRVQGGNDYISFIDRLLNVELEPQQLFQDNRYELRLFDNLADLYQELSKREQDFGLSRMVAGYAWPWRSKIDKNLMDIELDGLSFQWNQTDKDWVNSPTAFQEIGCIHTTQGYDLNYAGIIFGKEISYNPRTRKIEVDKNRYFDAYGKQGVDDPEQLKTYILNIYKTLLYRGIRGSFIYVCDDNLRNYLKQHIPVYKLKRAIPVTLVSESDDDDNRIPFVSITAAAGDFSGNQINSESAFYLLPATIKAKGNYFVCRVEGNSMNRVIPNGALCLFRQYDGGSRDGEIVLVQSEDIQDADFGAGYTVKKYQSDKILNEDGWLHTAITLSPMSTESVYQPIHVTDDALQRLTVIGIFVRVVEEEF